MRDTRKFPMIDKNVRPLVDWLNRFDNIRTQFSCHGHIGRPESWVIFSSQDLEVPYNFWKVLRSIDKGSLQRESSYCWTIKPWFALYDGLPGFQMVGTPIGRLGFLVRKKLPEEIVKLDKLSLFDNKEGRQKNKGSDNGDSSGIPVTQASARVFRLALGTSISIGSNDPFTSVTFDEFCHAVIYQAVSQRSMKATNTLLVFSPLTHGGLLWKAVNMLRSLEPDGAYKKFPQIDVYFTEDNQIILKMEHGSHDNSALPKGIQRFHPEDIFRKWQGLQPSD